MSRYKDLITGRTYRTEQNSLRHFISKAENLLELTKSGDEEAYARIKELYSESTYEIEVDKCQKCPADDFGYCAYRGDYAKTISKKEHDILCFEGWIKNMSKDLAEMQEKKHPKKSSQIER